MGLKRVKNQNKRFVFLNRSLFQSKHVFLFEITIINIMKQQIILPKFNQLLGQMGENIKLTRKRRKLTAVQVSERAGIARSTLYLIEKGDASVSLGAYFNVLRVLGLQNDFLKLADDDEFGRKLQDLELLK